VAGLWMSISQFYIIDLNSWDSDGDEMILENQLESRMPKIFGLQWDFLGGDLRNIYVRRMPLMDEEPQPRYQFSNESKLAGYTI
jgi:hypothetical protein